MAKEEIDNITSVFIGQTTSTKRHARVGTVKKQLESWREVSFSCEQGDILYIWCDLATDYILTLRVVDTGGVLGINIIDDETYTIESRYGWVELYVGSNYTKLEQGSHIKIEEGNLTIQLTTAQL